MLPSRSSKTIRKSHSSVEGFPNSFTLRQYSYLSVPQLTQLTDRMKTLLPWDEAEEVAFECEPGTLTDQKASRHPGHWRHSIESWCGHFDDHILEPTVAHTVQGDRKSLSMRPGPWLSSNQH